MQRKTNSPPTPAPRFPQSGPLAEQLKGSTVYMCCESHTCNHTSVQRHPGAPQWTISFVPHLHDKVQRRRIPFPLWCHTGDICLCCYTVVKHNKLTLPGLINFDCCSAAHPDVGTTTVLFFYSYSERAPRSSSPDPSLKGGAYFPLILAVPVISIHYWEYEFNSSRSEWSIAFHILMRCINFSEAQYHIPL